MYPYQGDFYRLIAHCIHVRINGRIKTECWCGPNQITEQVHSLPLGINRKFKTQTKSSMNCKTAGNDAMNYYIY